MKRAKNRKLRERLRTMKLAMPEAYRSRGRKSSHAARRRRKFWNSDLWNTARYRYDGTVKKQ